MPSADGATPAACTACSRRAFLHGVAPLAGLALLPVVLPALGACGEGGEGGGATPFDPDALPRGVTRQGGELRVRLADVPALAAVGGALLVAPARVLITRPGADDYRALDATCPHAGNLVSRIDDGRLVCPAHSSSFDLGGRLVAGPAESGLRALALRRDATAGSLIVTLA